MVSARRLVPILLVVAWAARASAQATPPDTTALLDPAREDALEDAGGETGLLSAGDPAPATAAPGGAWTSRASLRVARGGHALAFTLAAPRGRLALAALLAREPGERRPADDRFLRATWRATPALAISLGHVLPDAGLGLVLGPPLVGTRTPAAPGRGAVFAEAALFGASPARAATGYDGAWIDARSGRFRLALLAASTRRDARRVGDAWLPVAGVRHRSAREDSARAALGERVLGLALARGPAWIVFASSASDPRRVPPPGASAAEQRAAPIVRAARGLEIGARLPHTPWTGDARLAGALAFDARGRTRAVLGAEFAARARAPRAAIVFEHEAAAFTPLPARPERRPHAHVGALVRGARWRFEAHAVERRAFEPARLWASLRLSGRGGPWIEVRRDAAPARMLIAFRGTAGGLAVSGELRYDRHGLARELWRVQAAALLPGGILGAFEAALGAGRTASGWLDAEVPGGVWVAAGAASERLRVEVFRRRGRLVPRFAWLCVRTEAGPRSEARLAVEWASNPQPIEEDPGP